MAQELKYRTELPTNANVLNMLSLVLKCNCFRFNEEFYLQINGTAMGTQVAPTYAIIFMNWFEKSYVYTYHQRPRIWLRFIDDIWGVFRGTEQEFKLFLDHINSAHPSIKFTAEYSKDRVTFLDVTTMNRNVKIETTLFIKPTDNHGYLDFSSSHPMHNKTSIPYSQFLHIKRNCSLWEKFAKNSLKLHSYLSLRGYPHELIRDAMLKVVKIDRNTLLNRPMETPGLTNTNKVFCIMDYNPFNPDIKGIINRFWPTLERSSATRPLLECEVIVGHGRPKNLSEILCRSDVRHQDYSKENV